MKNTVILEYFSDIIGRVTIRCRCCSFWVFIDIWADWIYIYGMYISMTDLIKAYRAHMISEVRRYHDIWTWDNGSDSIHDLIQAYELRIEALDSSRTSGGSKTAHDQYTVWWRIGTIRHAIEFDSNGAGNMINRWTTGTFNNDD